MVFFGMPFLNWFLFFFLYVPIVILWISVIVDVFSRHDISGGAKFLWVVFVFVLPLFGSLIYLAARPSDMTIETKTQQKEEMQQRNQAA